MTKWKPGNIDQLYGHDMRQDLSHVTVASREKKYVVLRASGTRHKMELRDKKDRK
jgi:hypothetical protein